MYYGDISLGTYNCWSQVHMDFPIEQVRKIIIKASDRFHRINYGGCGVMAYILARQIAKVSETRIMARDSCSNQVIDEVRRNIKANTLAEWNSAGLYVGHAWVEFKVKNRWYGIDSDSIAPIKEFRHGHRQPLDGHFTIREMRDMSTSVEGWNCTFDRKQIPQMKRFLNAEFNKLFGPKPGVRL